MQRRRKKVFKVFTAAIVSVILSIGLSNADQIATTKDGKTVLLKDDGTWEYAEGVLKSPGKPWVKLPLTKRSEGLVVTLLDVYRTKTFGGWFQQSQAREGYEFIVVRLNIQSPGQIELQMYDSNNNLCRKLDHGISTKTWYEWAFEIPQGRQLKTLFIDTLKFDLTSVKVQERQ